MKAAAAAGVAGVAVLAGATPAMADTPGASLTVNPATNLLNNTPVDVEFVSGLYIADLGGVSPNIAVPLFECKQATYSSDPSVCSPAVGYLLQVDPTQVVYASSAIVPPVLKQQWSWVKGAPPNLTVGTVTCTRQCYLVAVGPKKALAGAMPSSASKHLVFGAPK